MRINNKIPLLFFLSVSFFLVACQKTETQSINLTGNDDEVVIKKENGLTITVTTYSEITSIKLEKDGLILLSTSISDDSLYTHNLMRLVEVDGGKLLFAYDLDGKVLLKEKLE